MQQTIEQTLPVTLDDVRAAAERIAPYIHHTALLQSATLSALTKSDFRLKAEHVQRSGSFKLRGALNCLLSAPEAARAEGPAPPYWLRQHCSRLRPRRRPASERRSSSG